MQKKLVVGILAHVDAGKTTLAESILYHCGNIRKLGRVDHGNAFLDTFALEKERGITIFSKQAEITWKDLDITLLDTPGHVDFSAEMERTLQVLDYAILVISGADGIQGHVQTLWRLLKRYQIPVFLFINKMDQVGTDKKALLLLLQERLESSCVEFPIHLEEESLNTEILENIAMCSESLMEEYLETDTLTKESIAEAICKRQLFPCYFGSALKQIGVETLLNGIARYTKIPQYPTRFGARVFKIARDTTGSRLTYLKVTGGSLKVKMMVSNAQSAAEESKAWQEKADQLRIYSGSQYKSAEEVSAGGICAVTGLTRTFAGEGLGCEKENGLPVLEPVLTYQMQLPEGSDIVKVLGQMRLLEEEEPELHVVWKEEVGEIHVQVMGEIQIEILKRVIQERFGLDVSFGSGSIVYKETIIEPIEGIGHFEPLRHYAEVHLMLLPGERGSGIQVESVCSEDILDKNWQRLILTHLEEKIHVGVLMGAEITDIRILLTAGKAHQKHTEGGDFRQATYRAVRHGLRRSKSILLEPVFSFHLEVPSENLGRAMSDIQRMYGSFDTPKTEGENSILTGYAPVSTMRDYQREVNAYTRGHGRFSCTLKGYEPCHNTEEVLEKAAYDPDSDLANPASSVFCAHGAGFVVNWDKVEEYAHVESTLRPEDFMEKEKKSLKEAEQDKTILSFSAKSKDTTSKKNVADYITQEEIEEIFRQTYGKKEEDFRHFRRYHKTNTRHASSDSTFSAKMTTESNSKEVELQQDYKNKGKKGEEEKKDAYLLVDGYNIIFAWEELRELAKINIDSARDRLMDILSNYQGYLGNTLILVFDAYKVKGNIGSVIKYHNIYVVYTKEAETADQYIEKTVHDIGRKHHVTVATSDALEQMIIWGSGAVRLSASGLKEAVQRSMQDMKEQYIGQEKSMKYYPFQQNN